MTGYSREEMLVNHTIECRGCDERPVHIAMPEKGKNILKFTNYNKQMKAPYIIYADFEAITTKIEEHVGDHTERTQLHEACGYSFVLVRSDGES